MVPFFLHNSAGRDFTFLNTSLMFVPGDTIGSPARCISIFILDDDFVEANEMFEVVVSSNSILEITGATSVPVTINEDPTDCKHISIKISQELIATSWLLRFLRH